MAAINEKQAKLIADLSHEKVLNETCWLYYCGCMGMGFGRVSDPCCASKRYLCCFSALNDCGAECQGEDGCCNGTATVCCITEHGQYPPMSGAPKFALCGLKCCGGEVTHVDTVFDYGKVFSDTCWLYYCCCFGVGVHMPKSGGTNYLCGQIGKCFCLRQSCHTDDFCKDGTLCEATGTTCCLWSEQSLPPKEGNPCIALFGLRLNKAGNSKPGQIEMQ